MYDAAIANTFIVRIRNANDSPAGDRARGLGDNLANSSSLESSREDFSFDEPLQQDESEQLQQEGTLQNFVGVQPPFVRPVIQLTRS